MSSAGVERAFREEWTAVVAMLARRLGDLQLAEDAAQEAFAAAAATWPRDGVPAKPGAWLTVTAWHRALNQLRRDRLFAERRPVLQAARASEGDFTDQEETLEMEDDRLRLIFTYRAVAVGMADGPGAGLAVLEPVLSSGALAGYSPLHASHAALLDRAGDPDAAAAAWARAIEATENAALRSELQRRVTERSGGKTDGTEGPG